MKHQLRAVAGLVAVALVGAVADHPAQLPERRGDRIRLVVTDSATGEPLFLARVTNPAAQ